MSPTKTSVDAEKIRQRLVATERSISWAGGAGASMQTVFTIKCHPRAPLGRHTFKVRVIAGQCVVPLAFEVTMQNELTTMAKMATTTTRAKQAAPRMRTVQF